MKFENFHILVSFFIFLVYFTIYNFNNSYFIYKNCSNTSKKSHISYQFCFEFFFCRKYLQILLWKKFLQEIATNFLTKYFV